MVRELTTKRFWGGCRAMVEFLAEGTAEVAVCYHREIQVKCPVMPALEPFKKLFQWCLLACNGYARVDSNQ
jgi:hypothetical protein